MTHGTTDPEALNDGTLTRPTLPPIVRQPRTPVKRWTVRTVGQPTITAETLAGLATHHNGNGHNGNGHDERCRPAEKRRIKRAYRRRERHQARQTHNRGTWA